MVLETVLVVAIGGLVLMGAVKLIGSTPSLMTDVKPCRGRWAEARLRGCEHGIEATGIPVEPRNAISSLAYLAAAWVTLRLDPNEPTVIVFAGAMALLCIGSTLYHGTKAMWCARLDHAGMYSVFAAIAFYGLAPEHSAIHWVMFGSAVGAAIVFGFLFPGNLALRMSLLLAFMSVRAFLLGSATMAGISLVLLAIAGGVWYLDRKTTFLGRWGHALWHGLTAGAIPAMFFALA